MVFRGSWLFEGFMVVLQPLINATSSKLRLLWIYFYHMKMLLLMNKTYILLVCILMIWTLCSFAKKIKRNQGETVE